MPASIRDIYTYLVTTLESDPTLQGWGVDVYSLKAPEEEASPYILLERQSAVHGRLLGNRTGIVRHWVFVKSVTKGMDNGKLGRQIMDRVKVLIDGQTPAIPSGYVAQIEAKTDLEYVEAETGNIQYFHIGTTFVFHLGSN